MKNIKYVIFGSILVFFALSSCKDEGYGDPGYTNPVVQNMAVSPTTFNFGDSLTLSADISDEGTNLNRVDIGIYAKDQLISTQSIFIGGRSESISEHIFVPLVAFLDNNSAVTFKLTAYNLTNRTAEQKFTGLTGNRPHFSQLYLVLQNGTSYTLSPQSGNADVYMADNLSLNGNFGYLIAQKLTGDGKVDFSGLVWGNVNGKLALVNESNFAFAVAQNADFVDKFSFDSYSFTTNLDGQTADGMTLSYNNMNEYINIDGENFLRGTFDLENGQVITLLGDFNDSEIIYHLDFFERIAQNKIKFLGETGTYNLYYNIYRKHLIVNVDNAAYPDFLLITGGGIGYPTKVPDIAVEHCWWGFDNVRQFLLGRKISDNVFQFTMMFHPKDDTWVSFKPYENTGWGGEKQFDQMTFTGDPIVESPDGNNWYPSDAMDPTKAYRLTINWATNVVDVQTVTL